MGTVEEVDLKIRERRARVMTASELKELVRKGEPAGDVDVVTCGTFGVMSGTMAVLSVPVAEAGAFRRADTISLNGVPAAPGPCPNESLGLVDCVVYGTSRRDSAYGGGHLFKDMVARRPIEVVVTSEGREFRAVRTLDEIPFARMILTRGAFKNYTCFVNPSDEPYRTIFSGPLPLRGGLAEASVSGCGEINPLQNDPDARYLGAGATALLNGAPAVVLGPGTRSTPQKPNLSIAADMHRMRPELMGGFRTSEGPECLTSVATAIPIVDARALEDASVLDEDTPMPTADVRDRRPVETGRYASVWGGDVAIGADPSKCLHCGSCRADETCPVGARPSAYPDVGDCMSCGVCVSACPGGVFSADLGTAEFAGRTVPVGVRQSSRDIAERLCAELKRSVESGEWSLRCQNGII